MNKTDFENGFALGFTSGGTNLLDHRVTFKANDEDYQIISVKNGNAVNVPVAEPADDGYNFIGWQHNGEIIEFPFVPTEDVELTMSERAWSDMLYEYYKVNREVYPYILFQYSCLYDDDFITPGGASMHVYFTQQLVKHESENMDGSYYIEAINYKGNTGEYSAGHATTTSLEKQGKEISSSNICNFILEYVNNSFTNGDSHYDSHIINGYYPSQKEYRHDTYWVTNDTTWANITPISHVKQVFIIA